MSEPSSSNGVLEITALSNYDYPLSAKARDQNDSKVTETKKQLSKGVSFWFAIVVINITYFVALLEATSVSTAIPTIVNDLHGGSKFIWIGSAYPLAAAALMPIMGGLAQVFGRRLALILALALFSVGSALCGAAHSMNILIVGRAIQGSGAAGLLSVSIIILSDLVPLAERGTYNGLLQLTFCFAAGIGPLVGGALSQNGSWRWLFFLNLPICGLAAILTFFFLKLKVPEGTILEKIRHIDWIGSGLIAASSCSVAIALSWGGTIFLWSSTRVLVPLCLGFAGFVAFFIYEKSWARNPIVPYHLLSNRTSLSGFAQNFLLQIPFVAVLYYLPVYFQSVNGYSALRSGVVLLGIGCSTAPFSIFIGLSVTMTKVYRPQIWIGWCFIIIGLALFSTVDASTSIRNVIGFEIICGLGGGLTYSTTYFPVLAPVPVSSVAYALSFYAFVRQFSQIWAITIGGAIFQNSLLSRLAKLNITNLVGDGDAAFEIISEIKNFPEPLRGQVRVAFADSIQLIWKVMVGITGLGLLVSIAMRHISLHNNTGSEWGLVEGKEDSQRNIGDIELDATIGEGVNSK